MTKKRTAAVATASLLGLPSDYNPEEDDFEDLPPVRATASRSRKRQRSSASTSSITARPPSSTRDVSVRDVARPPSSAASTPRRVRPSVAARSAAAPAADGSSRAVDRPPNSAAAPLRGVQRQPQAPHRRLGRRQDVPLPSTNSARLLRAHTEAQPPLGGGDDAPGRPGPALMTGLVRPVRPRIGTRTRSTCRVRGQSRLPRSRPVSFTDMLASSCHELPADPVARARAVVRQIGERREQEHQAIIRSLDRDFETFKRAGSSMCAVDRRRWSVFVEERTLGRSREFLRYMNGVWGIGSSEADSALLRQEQSAEIARESGRRSAESRRRLDMKFYVIRHRPEEQEQPEVPGGSFQTCLGWSSRVFRRVGLWMAKVACRYTSTSAGRLLAMSPYSEVIVGMLTIEETFNAFAARLDANWTDAFAMKLLRGMDHFGHDCECNLHSWLVRDSGGSSAASPRVPDVLMLRRLPRAPTDYLDACFLVRKYVSPHCASSLRLSAWQSSAWNLPVVDKYVLRPVSFSLAAAYAASDDPHWEVDRHESSLAEVLNRQPHLRGLSNDSEKRFVESRSGEEARTPIETHWHSLRFQTNGALSCGYCEQITARLPQPLARPFDRFVGRIMGGVEDCASMLQPLKQTLETLRARRLLARVGCARSRLEFPRSSGLLAGVTSTGVVCGVSWSLE